MGRRQLGQEAQQRPEGGQEEGGWVPGPTHAQPYQPSRDQRGVSKNIYSESKLTRYCISADNGRMWVLQGRRSTQSGRGCIRAPGAGARPAQHRWRRKWSPAPWGQSRRWGQRHTAASRKPGAHPAALQQERILDPHSCKEHLLPASPFHPTPLWDPSLKISQGPLEYLCRPDTCTWQHIPIPVGSTVL